MNARPFVRASVLGLWLLIVAALGCGKDATTSSPRKSLSNDPGHLDTIDQQEITGWAWDPSQPDTPVEVDIYDGDTKLTTVTADGFREDLKALGAGNGKHGFAIRTPDSLKDGKQHTVRAKITKTNTELIDSPKKVTLKAP
jgi:hypothetical protein